tara:strand:- start:726 stop:1034 length:309 start_codon:yes stop_codon:yes gene_type:complete
MKRLYDFEDAIGKTVTNYKEDRLDLRCLTFGDEYIVFEPTASYGSVGIELDNPLNIHDQLKFGLISKEEFEATKEENQKNQDEKQQADMLKQYKRLKRELNL